MSLNDVLLDPIEDTLASVGLMEGDAAPLKRAAVGAALGYAFATLVQPDFAYKDGKARPFALTAKAEDKDLATYFPVGAIVAIPAFILGVLI